MLHFLVSQYIYKLSDMVVGLDNVGNQNLCVCFQASPAALAKCVLAEVPKQVVEYFSHKAIPPMNPVVDSMPSSIANTPD